MKKALIFSLALNVIIVGIFAGKRIYYHQPPPPPSRSFIDDWNKMRGSLYEAQKIDSNDVVFVGTSLTEAFPVTEIYGPGYKNRGIAGNTTNHIINRIGCIIKGHPRKIFIEAGTNDLIGGQPVEAVFSSYMKIIDSIKRYTPSSLLYIQSTIPLGGGKAYLNDSVALLNQRLYEYCKGQGMPYIDLYSRMAAGNKLDSTLTEDGVHLNAKGYKIWEREISQHIN